METLMDRENLFCIHGPPGCGKTYSISQSALKNAEEYGFNKIMVCSLTRTAAAEAAGRVRLPRNQIGTLHSFAFRSLSGPTVAEGKIDEFNKTFPHFSLSTGQSDLNDQTFDLKGVGGENDEIFAEYTLNRSRMKPREAWSSNVKSFAKAWERWKSDNELMDFTDLIEVAARDTFSAPGSPDVIYMDEAQDSSTLEAHLLKQWSMTTQKTIIVGDPNQSLYMWRGADPETFFPHEMEPKRKHVLSQSFRVPKAVLDMSVRWISRMPGYKHEPYKPKVDVEGKVSFLDETLRSPHGIAALAQKKIAEGKTVMVLSSCGFMLNPLVAHLRQQGIPFHNPYRRKAGNWNPLHCGQGIPSKDRLMAWLAPRKDLWGEDAQVWDTRTFKMWAEILESKNVLRRGGKAAIDQMDPHQPLIPFMQKWFEPEALQRVANQDMAWWWSHVMKARKRGLEFPMFVLKKSGPRALADEPKLILGTVHSVKGGEADVVIVSPELSLKGFQEWQGRRPHSVYRLFYVAMTRAKEELYLLSSSGGRCLDVEWT